MFSIIWNETRTEICHCDHKYLFLKSIFI